MLIHIFNPEHEHALAADLANFTPPHAARQLRSDLAFFPALWAADGDVVLVEDVAAAEASYRKLKLTRRAEVRFATLCEIPQLVLSAGGPAIKPWGWDVTLCATLRKAGVPETALPSVEALAKIRDLSNRGLAVEMLNALTALDGTTGDSIVCHDVEGVTEALNKYGNIVVKAPWSCSGRGVRYLTTDNLTDNIRQWMKNILHQQQTLVAERKCQKVMDFAVEFYAHADGKVAPMGLSLFTTEGGAWAGNVLDTEDNKRETIARYLPPQLLDDVSNEACRYLERRIDGAYEGPLGIDMMVVAGDDSHPFLLNPCVEINLRRTMGHAALSLSQNGQRGTMDIAYEGKQYKVKLTK